MICFCPFTSISSGVLKEKVFAASPLRGPVFTIRILQPRAGNRHAVFFTHPSETITYHYERKLVPILNGQIVDESHKRSVADNGFLSYYDQTKYEAHQVALDRIAKGAPIVIVQPGGVYGPGDHSEIGNMIGQFRSGRMPMVPFPDRVGPTTSRIFSILVSGVSIRPTHSCSSSMLWGSFGQSWCKNCSQACGSAAS